MNLGRYRPHDFYRDSFKQIYCCRSASSVKKPHLEFGDKVIMPISALNRLASLDIDYPMLFEIHNDAADRVSHCGVLEFVAEEGMIYMPNWMMQNMLLQDGDIVHVQNTSLPKGTFVKLQPHTKDFLDISNPRAILERTLRNFSCLTTGDGIMVTYNNKSYYINILETKPASAVAIIETDCEVDFAPPLDYKEPEKPQQVSTTTSKAEDANAKAEAEPKFIPFTGSSKRLDGKPIKQQEPTMSSHITDHRIEANKKIKLEDTASTLLQSSSSGQKLGKLVFGSSSSPHAPKEIPKAPRKETKTESPQQEEPKFQPFTGKSFSFKD
ncbi:ubiquitin fusion degradation protein 1 homolog isoform X2 [Ananas comosus]|uniref:Ubiquitin fusion degradation protein 1 homolog isoform X2 n=1 Tax=Ananas comosus TaxID=4615 RepID=A0A6P5EJX0_ANACO|nr:ubiquitin fusion degradation protein 1 homolog isoform X2 [Ananas comosus]